MASRAGDVTASSHDHVVKVYDDDRDLVRGVTAFLSTGVMAGDLVIVVATPSHRVAFEQAADASAIDLVTAAANGRYLALDAHETLAAFMVDGVPDRLRFDAVMRALLRNAAPLSVRIFGEMVAVLWDDGDVSGAILLESLWNDLASAHPFTLWAELVSRATNAGAAAT
jgi:hypothetical protein